MTKHITIIVLLICSSIIANGQNIWMTRNLVNVPLDFLTHKDSIPNLLPVRNGMVLYESDSINLKDSIPDYFEVSEFYRDKISTFLLKSPHIENGLYITLDFVYDRLFQINLFTNESYYLGNFKLEIDRHFKEKNQESYFTITKDSTVNRGHIIVSYGERYAEYFSSGGNKQVQYSYYENLEKGFGHLILIDGKTLKQIPSWCGNCNRKKTWEKLKDYLKKKT